MFTRILILFTLLCSSASSVLATSYLENRFDDFDDTLYIDFIETITDDKLKVDFAVRSFDEILSMQFSVAYSQELAFDSLVHGELEGLFNPNLENVITYNWLDPFVQSATLEDGSILFSLYFTILGGNDGEVRITGEPTKIEVINGNEEQVFLATEGLNIPFNGSRIYGNVFADWINNCLVDDGETPLNSWILNIEGEGQVINLVTDSEGSYERFLEPGDYTIRVIPKNELWAPCDEPVPFTFTEQSIGEELNLGVTAVDSCTRPEISIETPFLRRCFDNEFKIQYCNTGTVSLDSSYIELNHGPELVFDTASIPVVNSDTNFIVFSGDTLGIGECKIFTAVFNIDCESTELGQTHCLEATITPFDDCIIDENWSQANIKVEGNCNGEEVEFIITNIGSGAMSGPQSFVVIEDEVMLQIYEEEFELGPGDTIFRTYPAQGTTYRLIANQDNFHPFSTQATAAVEGCGTNGEGQVSRGFFTQFSDDDAAPNVDVYCRENIGSFDPNDKTGYPKGYGEEAYIYNETDLEYLIRFQNTGTDTAFKVIIRDELIDEVDLYSIQVGPASHPFTWDIMNERTLVFIFDNILIPDSSANQEASQGYIKYKIKQTPGNEDGVKITNDANIYFDLNEPILTNETSHTIGTSFVEIASGTEEVIINQQKPINIYPNPAKNGIWVENVDKKRTRKIILYSSEGKVILERNLTAGATFFPKEQLVPGINYFTVISEDGQTYSGKVILIH